VGGSASLGVRLLYYFVARCCGTYTVLWCERVHNLMHYLLEILVRDALVHLQLVPAFFFLHFFSIRTMMQRRALSTISAVRSSFSAANYKLGAGAAAIPSTLQSYINGRYLPSTASGQRVVCAPAPNIFPAVLPLSSTLNHGSRLQRPPPGTPHAIAPSLIPSTCTHVCTNDDAW
jgi:hypothetical protein